MTGFEMDTKGIRECFDCAAEEYDSQRKKFIPCFDDFYETIIDFLADSMPEPKSILDLGAGTGLLSKFWFAHFKKSKYTLVDVSEEMLKLAEKRFQESANFNYLIDDYSKNFPQGSYDLISSALSIHHLPDEDKMELYRKIFKELPDNGYFINFDQFNANSKVMNDRYNTWWYNIVRKSGLPESENSGWLERRALDRENTIEETITMLKKTGFRIVECIYRYMKFGVVAAIKSG
jgi:ubiquinone/menaquinone biosynthesis C-methylase UbiE